MARPSIYKQRVALNLTTERRTKQAAARMAFRRGISISGLFTELIEREASAESDGSNRAERDNGKGRVASVALPPTTRQSSKSSRKFSKGAEVAQREAA
jgi:hypothetical protein